MRQILFFMTMLFLILSSANAEDKANTPNALTSTLQSFTNTSVDQKAFNQQVKKMIKSGKMTQEHGDLAMKFINEQKKENGIDGEKKVKIKIPQSQVNTMVKALEKNKQYKELSPDFEKFQKLQNQYMAQLKKIREKIKKMKVKKL